MNMKPLAKIKNETEANYPEIKEMGEDLKSLKNHAVDLGTHIKEDGQQQIEAAKESAMTRVHKVEQQVKANPMASVAIAFGAGVLASVILGRR